MVRPIGSNPISYNLRSFFSVPIAYIAKITTAVAKIFRDLFLGPQKQSVSSTPEDFSQKFFVYYDPNEKSEWHTLAGTSTEVIECMRKPGFPPSRKQFQLSTGETVFVPRVFANDLQRTNRTNQTLFINGDQIDGTADEALQTKVIEKLYNLLGKDAPKLFNLTEKACQNASIDLRNQVSEEYARKYGIKPGFMIQFPHDRTGVATHIQIDPAAQKADVKCVLTGSFQSFEKLGSMDEERQVENLKAPVIYQAQGEYSLTRHTIDFRIKI
ncbi:MAG: hypothetical protein V4487_07770 [Chlamydiota bacterium]